MEKYTAQDFKDLKKELKLTNKDVAEILNTSEENIKSQTGAHKPIGRWAVGMIYIWKHYKAKNENELRNFVEEYLKK